MVSPAPTERLTSTLLTTIARKTDEILMYSNSPRQTGHLPRPYPAQLYVGSWLGEHLRPEKSAGSIDAFQSIYTRISVTIPKDVVAVLAAVELVCSGGANDILESGLNINEAQNDVGKGGFVRSGGGTKKPALTDFSEFDQSRLRLRLISVK